MDDSTRCRLINNTFVDAYKSPLSVIVIDDIERFLSTSPIMPWSTHNERCSLFLRDRRLLAGGPRLLEHAAADAPRSYRKRAP